MGVVDRRSSGAGVREPVEVAVIGLGGALVMFFAAAAAALAVKGNAPTAFWAAGSAVTGGLLGLLARPPGDTPNKPDVAAGVARELTNAAAARAATEEAAKHPDDPQAKQALQDVVNRGVLLMDQTAGVRPMTALTVAAAAQAAATDVAQAHRSAAVVAAPTTPGQSAVLEAAATGAEQETLAAATSGVTTAAASPSSPTPRHTGLVLFLVFAVLLVLAIVLASGGIGVSHGFGTGAMDNVTKTVVSLASAAGSGLIGLYVPSKAGAGSGSG